MTPPLRRAHRFIWLLLAVALPVGFLATRLTRQSPLLQAPILPPQSTAMPVLLRTVDADSLVLNLRQSVQGTERQLEILLKQPFETPSAVVCIRQEGSRRAVGLLNAPGLYRFSLPTGTNRPLVEIVDEVHDRTVKTVQL